MYGKGLLKGLGVTGKIIFRKKVTEEYPEKKPEIPDRWKGGFQLDVSNCIACGLCEKACPNSVIKISKEKDENKKNILTGYTMNTFYCLFCGLCIEACPKKCLRFTKEFETAIYCKEDAVLNLFKNQNLAAPSSTYGQVEKKKREEE